MSITKTKNHAYTHDENRLRICLLCQEKKRAMLHINQSIKNLLENNVTYDPHDMRLPIAICIKCKATLSKAEKGSKKIILSDYVTFTPPQKETRSRDNKLCDCTFCNLARENGKSIKNKNKKIEKKKNRKNMFSVSISCG